MTHRVYQLKNNFVYKVIYKFTKLKENYNTIKRHFNLTSINNNMIKTETVIFMHLYFIIYSSKLSTLQ